MMKNNDFDFIKNKFDSAEPAFPENLDKNILKQKILAKETHRIIKFEQKKNYFKPLLSAAACFILILGIVFAANSDMLNRNKISGFNNYDEVNAKIAKLEKISSVSEGGSGIFCTSLVRDEEGVEKPDIAKADEEYIYYAYYDVDNSLNRNKVYIYNKKTEFISIIDHLAPDTNGEYADSYKINNLLIHKNRLVIFLDKSNPMSADKYKRDFNRTIIRIYDISDKSNPTLLTEFEQSGEYKQARMMDNILYVTSDYNVETNDKTYTIPWIKQNHETTYASPENIACFENTRTAQYVVISTIDVETGEKSEKLKAILGGSANIHCTKDDMYINEYIAGEKYGEPERAVSTAMKLNLKKSRFSYADEKEVKQYADSTIDIGRGDMYDSLLYPFGDCFISLGTDNESYQEELILFDQDMNELDHILFEENISATLNVPYFDKSSNTVILPAVYSSGKKNNYHYQGVVIFEIQNNKIVVKDRIQDTDTPISNDNRLSYHTQMISNGYVYSFVVDNNDDVKNRENFKVFSYKYE